MSDKSDEKIMSDENFVHESFYLQAGQKWRKFCPTKNYMSDENIVLSDKVYKHTEGSAKEKFLLEI